MHFILTLIIFTPLLGAGLILALPKGDGMLHRYVALFTTVATFLLSCLLMWKFDRGVEGIQFLEQRDWIETLKISYLIGVDGISVYLILLTALIFPLCIMASWELAVGLKGFYTLFLILETTILGLFSSQDLFLFFAFWEASILPIYFMLGVWGHENRVYAATKFFLFQLGGSVFMLLGMLAVYYMAEPHTFNLMELAKADFGGKVISVMGHDIPFGKTVFLMMLVGFAVRIPVFPLHSWFTVAQTEAPAVIAVVLAALFIKTGAYGLMRVNYALFSQAAQWMAFPLAIIGVVNVIYGAVCALGQKDLRRLVAYMCVSHMGFVLLGLGIFSLASFHGALLQMFSHGLYAGLLVFLVGILGDRSGHYNIVSDDPVRRFGGLVNRVPMLSGFFTVGVFASVGLPGFGAFPSQSMVFLGTFPVHRSLTILGLMGLVLTAAYFLWMFRRVFFGGGASASGSLAMADLTLRERLYLMPLAVLCVVSGLYPTPFIQLSSATLNAVLETLK